MNKEIKKVFISSPVRAQDGEQSKLMLLVASEGYEPVVPVRNDHSVTSDMVKDGIRLLLDSDAMVAPTRWRCTKLCEVEARVAEICNIPVVGRIDDDGNIGWLVDTPRILTDKVV